MTNHKVYILTGLPCSGKTTTGKILATILNYPFIDLDIFIESKYNVTIANVFQTKGEEYFRRLEQQSLTTIFSTNNSNLILSLGGGALCYNNNLSLCNNNGTLIWLNVNLDVIEKRLNNSSIERPVLQNNNVKTTLLNLHNNRLKFYQQAPVIININQQLEPLTIANNIISELSANY